MGFLDDAGSEWISDAGGEPEDVILLEIVDEEAPENPEPQPEAPEPAPSEPQANDPAKEPAMVPYAEMRKFRERAQEAERKLAEREQPKAIPDAYEQPQEFGQHFDAKFDQERFALRAEMSGFRAEQSHGKATVEAAVAWAQERNDPALGLKVRQSASPVELVVQEYQQSRTLEALSGKSLEDYVTAQAIAKGWIVSQEQPAPSPKPSSPTPPRSLASKPGSGGVGHTASGDAFGEVFSSTGMGLRK